MNNNRISYGYDIKNVNDKVEKLVAIQNKLVNDIEIIIQNSILAKETLNDLD